MRMLNSLENISVFPKPRINEIQVKLPVFNPYKKFNLYLLNGSLVKEGGFDINKQRISLGVYNIENGPNLLNLTNNKGERTFVKIIKE